MRRVWIAAVVAACLGSASCGRLDGAARTTAQRPPTAGALDLPPHRTLAHFPRGAIAIAVSLLRDSPWPPTRALRVSPCARARASVDPCAYKRR